MAADRLFNVFVCLGNTRFPVVRTQPGYLLVGTLSGQPAALVQNDLQAAVAAAYGQCAAVESIEVVEDKGFALTNGAEHADRRARCFPSLPQVRRRH